MKKKEARSRQIKMLLLSVIFFVFALLFIFSTVGRQGFNSPHKFALELYGTAQYGATKCIDYWRGLWNNYIALGDVRLENENLHKQLLKMKAINAEHREAAATNIRLNKLLGLKESLPPPTITAEIIGKDPSVWFKTIIVNKGSSNGVKKGMPAVTVEGVVGQVMDTSPHYAKILLAIDPNSAIDVLVQKTRVQGIIKGDGEIFKLHYVLKNNNIHPGDTIITSGFGSIFPKGLPLGTVSKAVKSRRGMFQEIEIKPTVDFSQLEYLIIIMKETSLAE
ncbi:MAG: rod shape-determining protein MreC [Desulfobulbaceae bacterium]|nr:rod shape-determining protein MreC [Desulfobulbaceae bacterium]